MSKQTNLEINSFRRQGIEEIAAELQLEEGELVRALVEMRPTASLTLKQRVRAITGAEPGKQIDQAGQRSQERMRPFLFRVVLRAGVVAAVLLVVVFLLLTAVPAARAAFGRFMEQRFGLVLVEPTLEATPAVESELKEGETLTEAAIPPISLEEAQAQVAFTIPLPRLLPEGFTLWAARVGAGPHGSSMDENGNMIVIEPPVQVILAFKPDESNQEQYHPDATLSLDIFDRVGLEGGYAVLAGSEVAVEVNGSNAVFVKGTWVQLDESRPPSPDNITWDDTADSAKLSWEADGFTYILSGSHLELSREAFIRIAESVR
jgi:hypothetical protein